MNVTDRRAIAYSERERGFTFAKIAISSKLQIRSKPNLRTNLRPTIALRGLSNIIQIKSNMADGRHLEMPPYLKIDMIS